MPKWCAQHICIFLNISESSHKEFNQKNVLILCCAMLCNSIACQQNIYGVVIKSVYIMKHAIKHAKTN